MKMPRRGGFIHSLMLQKSIRLFQTSWLWMIMVDIPLHLQGLQIHPQVVGLGISEPSTVDHQWLQGNTLRNHIPKQFKIHNLTYPPVLSLEFCHQCCSLCLWRLLEMDFLIDHSHMLHVRDTYLAPRMGYAYLQYICHTTLYSMLNVGKYHGASGLKGKSESCGWSGFRPPNWMKEVHQHWLRGGWAERILNHRMLDPSSTQVTVEKGTTLCSSNLEKVTEAIFVAKVPKKSLKPQPRFG